MQKMDYRRRSLIINHGLAFPLIAIFILSAGFLSRLSDAQSIPSTGPDGAGNRQMVWATFARSVRAPGRIRKRIGEGIPEL